MSFDLRSLVDADNTIVLEVFITSILTGGNVWNGLCSDGVDHMQTLHAHEDQVCVFGIIWEIEHQTTHSFLLEIQWVPEATAFEWSLSFEVRGVSPRRQKYTVWGVEELHLLSWNVRLVGEATEQDGALIITGTPREM